MISVGLRVQSPRRIYGCYFDILKHILCISGEVDSIGCWFVKHTKIA